MEGAQKDNNHHPIQKLGFFFSFFCCEPPYAKRALRDAKFPASLEQAARLIQSNRSVAGLVFVVLVFLMTGAILFQTENVVFPSQRSLIPANPNEIVRAIAGEEGDQVPSAEAFLLHIMLNSLEEVFCFCFAFHHISLPNPCVLRVFLSFPPSFLPSFLPSSHPLRPFRPRTA